jgi:hypothetical protein
MKMRVYYHLVIDFDVPEPPAPAEGDFARDLTENFNHRKPHPLHEMYSSYDPDHWHDDHTRWGVSATTIERTDQDINIEMCKPLY